MTHAGGDDGESVKPGTDSPEPVDEDSKIVQRSEDADEAQAEAGPIPAEVLEKLPPRERRQLETIMMGMASWGPMPNPFAAKVTAAHIDKVLDLQDKEMDLGYKDRHDARRISSWVLVGLSILLVVTVIILSLADKDAVLSDLLPLAFSVAGGFGGGYGYAEVRRRRGE